MKHEHPRMSLFSVGFIVTSSALAACGLGSGEVIDLGSAGTNAAADNTHDQPRLAQSHRCDGSGLADEDCPCSVLDTRQACYSGPSTTRNSGQCKDGYQLCAMSREFPLWGPCVGDVKPATDGDTNCGGVRDQGSSSNSAGKQNAATGGAGGSAPTQDSGVSDDDPSQGAQDKTTNVSNNNTIISGGGTQDASTNGPGRVDVGSGNPSSGQQDPRKCPPGEECCDGVDNNHNGQIDEGHVCWNVGGSGGW